MPDTRRCRYDRRYHNGSSFVAVWSLQVPWFHEQLNQYLVAVYRIHAHPMGHDPVVYDKDATHEFIILAVDPDTPIDFDIVIFDQKELSPLTPPTLGFQFRAESNNMAVERVRVAVKSLWDGKLSPDRLDGEHSWVRLFNDGVPIIGKRTNWDRQLIQ